MVMFPSLRFLPRLDNLNVYSPETAKESDAAAWEQLGWKAWHERRVAICILAGAGSDVLDFDGYAFLSQSPHSLVLEQVLYIGKMHALFSLFEGLLRAIILECHPANP